MPATAQSTLHGREALCAEFADREAPILPIGPRQRAVGQQQRESGDRCEKQREMT